MKRFAIFLAIFGAPAMAQTTLDITVPGAGNPVCSYITGPVTNETTPGHLQATATSSSGAGCGTSSGGTTFGPASPLAPQTTTVASGSAVSYSFQALNATSCSGTISGGAPGSFAGGNLLCSAGTCSNKVTASASFTNPGSTSIVDTVTVTCTGSSVAQSVANVTVSGVTQPPPPGSCPKVVAGDGTAGVTSFVSQGQASVRVGGDQHTISADMSSFASVLDAFPGRMDTAYDNLPVNNYISMQFQPPAGFFANAPDGWYQKFQMGTTGDDTKMSMTISTSCGDFSDPVDAGSSVVQGCRKVGGASQTGIIFSAQLIPGTSQCVLADNTTYYWNIINANVTGVTPTGGKASSYRDGAGSSCTGQGTCSVPIQNGPKRTYPGYP